MARFSIDVRIKGGLSLTQQDAFQAAAQRWGDIIIGDFPRVKVGGEIIEALTIEASGTPIDGPGQILGQSSPRHLLPTGLPATGFMQFDTDDLAEMERDGSLRSVILHEMGHVLGIGSIWDQRRLLRGPGTQNPVFTGAGANEEWTKLGGSPGRQLPVENQGGPGTEDSHWREMVFGDELMTGWISGQTQPLSRMTIASLADMGYRVDLTKADSFELPSHLDIRAMGVGAAPQRVRRCSLTSRSLPRIHMQILPETALL